MNDTKLIQTLKTFSKDEIKNFGKFVASPFFNNGRNYLPLVSELQKFYPGFDDENLTSEYLYKKIYPGRKFNKQVMWNQVSQLEKLAIEFLLQTALKNNKLEGFILIFDELSKRNLEKQTFREITAADKNIGAVKFGKEYFYAKWIIENNKVEYWTSQIGKPDKSFDSSIKSTEYLILNLLADLSISVSDLQIIKLMYNASDEVNCAIELVKNLDLKKLVDSANKSNHEHAPVMTFYYNKIMCALDEKEEKYFFEMKKFFDVNYDLFDKLEQKNTIISLANYCAHKMRLGDRKYLKLLFEINKFRLEKGIDAYKNRRIDKALYHQIIRNALSLGEIKWAENFVKENTPKLRRDQQKTMSALALGYIHYAKNEYAESLEFLNKVEFIDLRDKLHVRILSAKAYYELDNTESLFYYIDSSKHFIGNNPAIEGNTKEAYLKFFNFLNKLLTCKENHDPQKLKMLREDIVMDNSLRSRHKIWLLDKADKM